MNDEIKQYLSKLGKKGWKTRKARYTHEDFKKWGSKGGRPRKKPTEKLSTT
jgi:hypothetical protein